MKQKETAFLCVLAVPLLCSTPLHKAHAEEGGGGAYTPGAIASLIDSMLPASGGIVRVNYYNYQGENDLGCLDASCSTNGLVDATAEAVSFTLGWRPDIDLGKDWSYMMSTTIPYVRLTTDVNLTSGGRTTTLHDSETGLGDIELIPLNVSYHLDEENQINFKATARAPTGSYDKARLANIGKNYWSYEPTIGFVHCGKDHMDQLSIYSGLNFNTKNEDTDYTSGTQAHIEFTAEKRYSSPSGKGVWGFGVTGYFYRQLEDDEQFGVDLSDSRSRANGIGPVISYTGMFEEKFTVVELKWLHDYASHNKFEGDTVLLKAGIVF